MNSEFQAYEDELLEREHYTLLSPREMAEYDQMAIAPKVFKMEYAKSHPFLFAYHVIGIKPRPYQFKMLDHMFKYGRVATVTSRQIGKSTVCAIYAFWAAYSNAFPSGPQKNTKVLITSHTEQAAKDLLRTIDSFITMADERMLAFTMHLPNKTNNYFRNRIKLQNQFEIHWPKGSIKIYPPTGKVRGNSADVLIIDEAHWLHNSDPDYFFSSDAMPTVSATKGRVFLFSTPKNLSGFFYDIINPLKDQPLQGWRRLWFPWVVVNNEDQKKKLWEDRLSYIAKGDELDFKIEYEADFLSGKHTFFDPESIDAVVDETMREEYTWENPVTLGIDFGDVHSRTVITVVDYNASTKTCRLIWYKEFPQGFNNADLTTVVQGLRQRYKIKNIVYDDCVGGKTAIELLRRKGFHMIPFVFVKQKIEYYEYLKVAILNKRVLLYKEPTLIHQLKSLESHETVNGRIQIRKPNGGRDDIADSLMMACSPYIQVKEHGNWRFHGFRKPEKRIRVVYQ